jgi:glyoxylase-like metal-dependent hydrolase (beta-lactamase superfamily II)
MRFVLAQFLFFFLSGNVAAQDTLPKLVISNLTGDFYIYTTYKMVKGYRFPSNSMYLVTNAGVVLFDTPWDETQFQPLLDSIYERHQTQPVLCIATHFHDDRTAGLIFFKDKGIATCSSRMTYQLCALHDEKQAEKYFTGDTTFAIGGHVFETYYPGQGHSPDNIVIWFEKEKILYGGCLVKSEENQGLGNIADANLSAWGNSILNVMKKYPDAQHVIPGHFAWSDKKALSHTFNLVKRK